MVLEIIGGIVIGPSGFGWVRVDLPVQILALFGLAFLLFLAGLGIDVRQLRGRLLRFAVLGYLATLVLGYGAGASFAAVGWVSEPLLLAITLSATSLGDLARGGGTRSAAALLLAGGALWTANVLIFALWYWELDRGARPTGAMPCACTPTSRSRRCSSPGSAPPGWTPTFTDYLYLSFANAISFSAGDVAPLTRWAKLMMMLQSAPFRWRPSRSSSPAL